MGVVAVALAGTLASQSPRAARDVVTLEVDARARIGRVRPIWDETNLWKLQSMFGASHPDPARWWGPGWLRRHAPWIRYARLLAAVGGNYAPAIAPWCDWGRASPEHPDARAEECGRDGTPGAAAADELVKLRDGTPVVDYAPFRVAIERVLRSGVRPHLNLSAAPAIFTGGAADFTHYHWNAAPIVDLAGWSGFVAGAFRSVADLHPERWRVSITNEPNCLTLVGWEGSVQHVGFAGTPDDYGRIFVAGAGSVRSVAPGIALHAGNYVTSATFPGEDNLRTYLRFLRDAFARADGPGWESLDAVSLSLYETRDTTVYELVSKRVHRLRAAVREAGLSPLPTKVDELEIHPTIAAVFDERTRQKLDATAFAASWHAEAVRQFVADGDVVSIAPWLFRMFDLRGFAPYPKARVYALLGLLAGELRTVRDEKDGGMDVRRTTRRHGLPRLAVTGELPPHVAVSGMPPSSLGALATRTPDGVRLLVVHHQLEPVSDGAGLRRQLAQRVRVRARNVAPGAYRVRAAVVGTGDGVWNGTTTPLRWRNAGCVRARDGAIDVAPPTDMPANTVWLLEARRSKRCPRSTS
jgi:hypothetical protein